MNTNAPLITTGTLPPDCLKGQIAIVTGAGRGVGYQAARALCWLGAQVVIAEIDRRNGRQAAEKLNREAKIAGRALFILTDVGSESSVRRLKHQVLRKHGRVDIVLNNACRVRTGAVKDTSIRDWDLGYRVNLRGPVLMAQAFLPDMVACNRGVFVTVSSKGTAYMGPYETYKAGQVHLGETLAAELEGTNVVSFTIGPGLVQTPGLLEALPRLAKLYGKTEAEFIDMSRQHLIGVEAAGAGFAAAIALAPQFSGQEIGSIQALIAAGIDPGTPDKPAGVLHLAPVPLAEALELAGTLRVILTEQSAGWEQRSLFERQWVVRDFRKYAGMPVEQWLGHLAQLEADLKACQEASGGQEWPYTGLVPPLSQLADYFKHTREMYEGYEKDPKKLAETRPILEEWQRQSARLVELMSQT